MIQNQPYQWFPEIYQKLQDVLIETDKLLKKLTKVNSHQKTNGELLAEEQESRERSQHRKSFIYNDDNDEASIQVGKFYSVSSYLNTTVKDDGRKSMEELLAELRADKLRKAFIYDDDSDDDEERIVPFNVFPQIAPICPPVRPEDSLTIGDEPLNTIPATESDEINKSSVENLVPIQSESGETSNGDGETFENDRRDNLVDTNDKPFDDTNFDLEGDIRFLESLLLEEPLPPLPPKNDEVTDESIDNHDEICSESDEGYTSLSCGEIEYVEEEISPCGNPTSFSEPNIPDFSPKEIDVLSEIDETSDESDDPVFENFKTTFTNPLFDFEPEFTMISDNPLFDIQIKDSDESVTKPEVTNVYHKVDSLHDEFLTPVDPTPSRIVEVSEPTKLSSPNDPSSFTVVDASLSFFSEDKIFKPGLLSFKDSHGLQPDILASFVTIEDFVDENLKKDDFKTKEKVKLTMEDLFEFDLETVVMIFLPFLTYAVVSPIRHSLGSEDVVFDPGILRFMPVVCSICSPKDKSIVVRHRRLAAALGFDFRSVWLRSGSFKDAQFYLLSTSSYGCVYQKLTLAISPPLFGVAVVCHNYYGIGMILVGEGIDNKLKMKSFQLGFHLDDGWSGVLDVQKFQVSHIHCPPPPWLDGATSNALLPPRKPSWLPEHSIYAVGSTSSNELHLLDFYPNTSSPCHCVTVCATHPLNGTIVAGTLNASLLMISQDHRSCKDEGVDDLNLP
ncbi:WD40/YVTN repeat-like-containing domain-containing protein [Artemisia annua]|uniref:WD40/YVTN repeat-like-containing domain-containing protein n=1 Tax=Artemisia annua TaxID=35608 RepID=A0A2U1PR86_ARTAN|nr:WD40/YVTN repeat-like-containing domain-containing protein [Artemisia annua]